MTLRALVEMIVFSVSVHAAQIPLENKCSVECRIDYTPDCPKECTTLNDMLSSKQSPNEYSPMDIADVIRKTFENAENNKANYTGVTSPLLDKNGNLKKDPLDNTPNTKGNYTPNNNALLPSLFNPIDPNNTNPNKNTDNGNGTYNPGGVGDNLLPPTTNPSDINKWAPTGPSVKTHNDPNNVLDTRPRGFTPSPPSPLPNNVKPGPIQIGSPVVVQTVISYVPQVTTITKTSPPVILEKTPVTQTVVKSVTTTQPPKYIRIPPQTYVQTLPASTITKYKLETATEYKTFVQPVELPRETLTSYAPVMTKTEEKVITSIVKLPPCTKTILSTVTLPATTVFVVKTQALPTEMNIKLNDSTVSPQVQPFVPISPDTNSVTLPNVTYVNTKNGIVPIFNGSGKNINGMGMFDINEFGAFCKNNKENRMCLNMMSSNCVPSKINICYNDMLKATYQRTHTVDSSKCGINNVKVCEVVVKNKNTPTDEVNENVSKLSDAVSNFYKSNKNASNLVESKSHVSENNSNDPTITSRGSSIHSGLLSRLKNLLKKKSDLVETDIGEAYNEKNNKTVLLSDLVKKDEE